MATGKSGVQGGRYWATVGVVAHSVATVRIDLSNGQRLAVTPFGRELGLAGQLFVAFVPRNAKTLHRLALDADGNIVAGS